MPAKKTSFAAAAKAAVVASESPSPPAPLQRNISTKLRRRPAPDGHRDSTVGALSGLNEGGEIEDDGARLLVEAQANSQYFRGFLQDIDVLTKALSIVHFDPAETILQEGEPGTWVGLLALAAGPRRWRAAAYGSRRCSERRKAGRSAA